MQLIEWVIDPQMSFGTGYHESTRLALQHLDVCLDSLDRVLDVGTGTGILAIAAAKLGAQSVLGLDFDTWSFKNASENIVLNQVDGMVEIRQGTIESVGETGFTLILANINRTVWRNDLPSYVERAAPKAEIILSGLQLTDKALITSRLKKNNLLLLEERIEANWWSVRASLSGELKSFQHLAKGHDGRPRKRGFQKSWTLLARTGTRFPHYFVSLDPIIQC